MAVGSTENIKQHSKISGNSQTSVLNSTIDNVNEEANAMAQKEVHRKNSYNTKLLQMPPSCKIDIAFENISYKVPLSSFTREKKLILKGVSGEFKSGEVTAIMGPSGAGKSSLLNVLSGFIVKGVSGNVFANGLLDEISGRNQVQSHSSYILQEDYLLQYFTVMETMMHAANLKLTTTHNNKSKILLIENILESMSLSEAKNTRCNRLSGGEKKRLNICLELIDNPPILFLDEPTSGLDSLSSMLLVRELKGLSQAGRTVICTIHQPSAAIFSQFDHLYLMASGSTIYQGDAANLLSFLEYIGLPCPVFHNPADYVMDIASGEFGSYLDSFAVAMRSKKWRSETEPKEAEGEKMCPLEKRYSSGIITDLPKKPSEWERFKYLVVYIAKQHHRDWSSIYLKVVASMVLGILLGGLFKDVGSNGAKVFSNLGYLYSTLVYLSFTTLMPAALQYPTEINILKKEHFNNWYEFKTYYVALLIVQIPIQIFLTFIYTSTTYYLTGQILEIKRFLIFLGAGINCSVFSLVVGLFMGTFGSVNGVFCGSTYILSMTMVGGFIAFIKDLPFGLYIFSFVSYLRYSFEVTLVAVYGLNRGKLPCPESALYCHHRFPELLFRDMGLEPEYLLRNILALGALTISQATITYFYLRHSLKHFKKIGQ